MKITRLTTYRLPPRWMFLKIETDEGITGWGEPVIEGRARTVETAVAELADYLIGKDPSRINDLWQTLYRAGFYRGGPILMSAIAGIDQALWDIKGKVLGAPVYELLGGLVRDKMKMYSWVGGDRPAEVIAGIRKLQAIGFDTFKLNGCEEMALIDNSRTVDAAVAVVAEIREAFGNSIEFGLDFHGRVAAPMARVLIRELEPYRPLFIEEPVLERVLDDLGSGGFAMALLQGTRHTLAQDADPAEGERLRGQIAVYSGRIAKLMDMAAMMESQAPALRRIDDLEAERAELARQLAEHESKAAQVALIDKISEADVQRELAGLIELARGGDAGVSAAVMAVVDRVELDPVSLDARLHYRVVSSTSLSISGPVTPESGVKVASPRGFEPRSLP